MLGNSHGAATRAVQDLDSQSAGGGHVDVVQTRTGATNSAQVQPFLDDVVGDSPSRADHQGLIVTDNLLQCFTRNRRTDVN